MRKSKFLKMGTASILSMTVLAACAEEEPVEEEVVEEEVVEEEPVEEEVVEEEVVEEEPVAAEFDYGVIDPVEFEDEYLEPLGWTAVEFNDYTVAEYDTAVADFADFAELETTVGPVEDILAAEEGVETGVVVLEDLETAYLDPLGWSVVEFNDYAVTEYDTAIADFADFAELETTVGPVEDILVAEEDLELGAVALEDLNTTYLEPLAWSAVEFNDYVVAEYDTAIVDFADFSELETTVGPVEDIDVDAVE
ncbi:hypothetical protein [Planococcus lenghuensis]|uniref:Processed acidic surface protein n=1 Tax=Planococcus lenghuensis TaxID=2213202 RepID=A0A1Q2KVY2_9BACL|nr:hypothetical protein [Planococcus lenghuensis]AQQ52274.1 hypothetical protein B0X71_03540 [Planococcus lenghuensis]